MRIRNFAAATLTVVIAAALLCSCAGHNNEEEEQNIPESVGQLVYAVLGNGERTVSESGTVEICQQLCTRYSSVVDERIEAYIAVGDNGNYIADGDSDIYRQLLITANGTGYRGAVVTSFSDGAAILFKEILGSTPDEAAASGTVRLEGKNFIRYVARVNGEAVGYLAAEKSGNWYFSTDGSRYCPLTYSPDKASFDASAAVAGN